MNQTENQSEIVQSPAMTAPVMDKLLRKFADPIQREAPQVHSRIWEEEDGSYVLGYNGVSLIRFRFPSDTRAILRFHSDGDFQSEPFIQQFLLWSSKPAAVQVSIQAPVEWWNIRPERAGKGQAVLGQLGRPLLYGVNGLYFPDWDLLVSLHGVPFRWKEGAVQEKDGMYFADLAASLSDQPWVILFRPHYFNEHLGYKNHKPWNRRPKPDAVCGWCSWEAYHSDVTLQDIREAASSLQGLKPWGLRVMQLDDGYQQAKVPLNKGGEVGESWLKTNEKFPGGHEAIVGAMKDGGFTPGIWLNATLTDKENAKSIQCCLKDEAGELLCGDWIRYVMDCTPGTLAVHVEKCYRELREQGYEYFKADSIRHLLYDGLEEAVRRGLLTTEEARARHKAYIEAARRGIGEETYFLSCWGVLSSTIGTCDAMRVATDANPSWSAYSMQLRETQRWFFAQRILFTIDPDHVCVRGKLPWVRMMLSLVSLSGGLMMISDPPSTYDEERLDLMKRTMPPLEVHTGEVGPLDYTTPACARVRRGTPDEEGSYGIAHEKQGENYPDGSLWAFHMVQGGRAWCVVQRCAPVPVDEVQVPLEQLALDPDRQYYAFDFWEQRAFAVDGGSLPLRPLSLGDTQVAALTDITDESIILLGSDRHVSCDAVSVLSGKSTPDGYELVLSGFEGLRVTYTLYARSAAELHFQAQGAEAEVSGEGRIRTLRVLFREKEARVRLYE